MTDTLSLQAKERYLSDCTALAPAASDAVAQLRAAGLAQCHDLDFPHKKQEEWRHTDLTAVLETPFRAAVNAGTVTREALAPWLYADSDWGQFVFVDGVYDAALSTRGALPETVRVGGLAEALAAPCAKAVAERIKPSDPERSIFTALNTAFLKDGACVYVQRNTVLEAPIHLLFVSTAQGEPAASHPRNLLVLEENAQASVVCTYVSAAERTPTLVNLVETVVLGANARLTYCKLTDPGADGHHIATHDFVQERDSVCESYFVTLSGGTVRHQPVTRLAGEGASCFVRGLYLAEDTARVDNHVLVAHEQPHGTSRIFFRGILEDESHAVFLGKVHVHPGAQLTDSEQLSNALLLSEKARVNAKPQLEIYADDVKCTHGATVGPPPEAQLFYLRSRGIGEATARGMLTRGFAEEVIDTLGMAAVRDRIARRIVEKFQKNQ